MATNPKDFAASTGKVVYKIGNTLSKYLKKESGRYYALLEPVSMLIVGKDCGGINWRNHVFEINSIGKDSVMFVVQPFDETTHYWNGPSVIDDCDDGRIEASLIHDLIWEWVDSIANDNDKTREEVLTWSNRHLAAIWRAYAKKKGKLGSSVKFKSWLAANVCNCFLAKIWKKIISCIVVALLFSGCTGCLDIPEWKVDTPDISFLTPEQLAKPSQDTPIEPEPPCPARDPLEPLQEPPSEE